MKKLILILFLIFFNKSFSMVVRCGCNKGCDQIISGFVQEKICYKACQNFGGWNGKWARSYVKDSKPNCEGIGC